MLKKNLVRSGFLSQGLLLFVPNAGSIISYKTPGEQAIYYETSMSRRSTVDTLIVHPFDSLAHTYSRELTEQELSAGPQISMNSNVTRFVKNFLKKENEFLVKMKQKSAAHFHFIDSVFTYYGLPVELKYLAIVESQLNTKAVSRVGAKGMWQFMPVTARELGLKVSSKYDERLNARKSTVAAARYLRSLYREFGDWLLALAAYNGGPGTVYKAIKRSGSRNFWVMQYHLPEETRGHVKRFIGVHYFFEGTGSITTQTKSEAIAYKKAMDKYKMALRENIMTDSVGAIVVK